MLHSLVVDDSATARALIVAILQSDPGIQVVGEGKDGVEAVELTQKLRPQVITMDLRMPRLDGFEATKEIMITVPTPIVIVTASTERTEVEIAMHALRAGAVAVLRKPRGPGSPGFEEEAQKLVATVKSMAEVKVVRHWRPGPSAAVSLRPPERTRVAGALPSVSRAAGPRCAVVAIATSTGGPAALQRMLGALPGDFSAPILVVQHITPGFTPGLAAWLNTVCDLQVKVAEPGERLAPHTVYLAPDDRHLGVAGPGLVTLSSAPPVGGFRPSGTFLFESVARAFGPAAVGVILTGMGDDGVVGLRAVRQAGGRVLGQDEKSCVVFGMPGAAAAAGQVNEVLALDAIPARLLELVS
jgi:two-component system chemotaxis response regulator CheB